MTWVVLDGPSLAPIEAAARLAGRPGRFLLHSGSDADGCGHWSFVSAEPVENVRGRLGELQGDPFASVAALAGDGAAEPGGPVPLAVGYFGYELARVVERLPARARAAPPSEDDLWFGRYDAVWRSDGTHAQVVGRDRAACVRLHAALSAPADLPAAPELGELLAEAPDEDHLAAVTRALAYIHAGDIYQVNLARRLSARLVAAGDPLALYARIAAQAPAPFGALVETGRAAILSDSPELFVRRLGGTRTLETRPIKGTRARGPSTAADAALAAELQASEKERAEHLMIVDLLRNDLGRVARTGTVAVQGFARLVSLPTVHHLVSTVTAELDARHDSADVLRAIFPGGSITGAPKVRAMEIIDELEPRARGVYTGALGYLGAGGAIELAIVIRTAVLDEAGLHLSVGGGIVADSTPARELAETEEKAAAWRRAVTGA